MPLSEKKILIVEDHADTAELIQRQLQQIGYPTSLVAINGPDALQKVHEGHPDLILLDISLPGMSGFEVAGKLKADPFTSSIPILAVTAKAMPGDREKCLQSGCDGYLAKPFLPQQLKAEIEKLLPQT
ncbi:MAG: response regulator [Deltaproteobacteria bacterium]|nr:response regulator [Deltaproteobacteria bacterium]